MDDQAARIITERMLENPPSLDCRHPSTPRFGNVQANRIGEIPACLNGPRPFCGTAQVETANIANMEYYLY
jgi:hypothetical protein